MRLPSPCAPGTCLSLPHHPNPSTGAMSACCLSLLPQSQHWGHSCELPESFHRGAGALDLGVHASLASASHDAISQPEIQFLFKYVLPVIW